MSEPKQQLRCSRCWSTALTINGLTQCVSSEQWCENHPRPGRENMPRGTYEPKPGKEKPAK